MPIRYQLEPELGRVEFVDVLKRSTLAARRPVDNLACMEGMLHGASIIVTARDDDLLVGVSRAISDFAYCTYLSDLAVDEQYQRQGIGKRLIDETHRVAGKSTALILLSAPQAVNYYPHIGLTRHDSCWIIRRTDDH